jgi:amino acid adenylation domain-containing protein
MDGSRVASRAEADIISSYGLSPMQIGMLFHQLFDPHAGADLEQMVMRLDEPVDGRQLRRAWDMVARRHEVLRTSFHVSDDAEPVQRVHRSAPMEVVEVDQSAYTENQADRRLARFLAVDRQRGFDAATAPLSRTTIFHRDRRSVIVWTFHHVILDGRSFPIVLTDLFAAYDDLRAGETVHLEPSTPYRSFIEALAAKDMAPTREFWRATMAGFRAPTPLTVDRIGAVDPTTSGFGEVRTRLDETSTAELQALASSNGVTLNTTLQAAWGLLLSIYSGETDIVFGVTRSGRHGVMDGTESMAGLFINTVPLRLSVERDATVTTWLRDIRALHVAMRDHEQLPLVEIQALSEIQAGNRLFDSILVFESYQLDQTMRERTGTGDRVAYELLEQTNHPLLLSVYGGRELDLRLEFDKSLFDQAVVERMVGHVVNLLRSMVAAPAATVGDLRCLDDGEAQLVGTIWPERRGAGTPTDMVTRWRDQVGRTPEAVALIGPDGPTSFAELDAASDRLGRHLVNLGIAEGDMAAIMTERSAAAIIAILGALKAGAAYLPLDSDYPPNRLRYMLEDSGAAVVLTTNRRAAENLLAIPPDIGGSPAPIIVDVGKVEDPGHDVTLPGNGAERPAYMIYTSGSTGKPKGVVVSHESLVNHADGVLAAYELTSRDRVLQFAALSFDVAAEELFPTWLAGASVVLRTDEVSTSFEALHRFIERHAITVLNLPAAFWSAWVDNLADNDLRDNDGAVLPPTLRAVITGSEGVPAEQYRRWTSLAGTSIRWLNAYGPTETTITATVYDPTGADRPPGTVVPIGRPIHNVTCRVLDERGRPTPIGVPGELHIGGAGVALHYHGRPDLTKERFVPDQFSQSAEGRCYRTGDLARWLPDGNLEFLGRIDDQVKIRGFRIELGEIEAALRDLDGVSQAAVVTRTDPAGSEYLEAHVVAEGDAPLDASELRRLLATMVPGYMVPAAIGRLDSLPLTPSGKVDRRALPEIEVVAGETTTVAPRTDLERQLAEIWSDVLGVVDVGIHDNFFDVGGNSLSAIRLFSAVKKLTGEKVELPELFASPSIGALAALLGDPGGTDHDVGQGSDRRLPSWVVPVKATGTRPPLFHLGGASVLRDLARHLPADQPLYAVLEQDLGADHFMTSVEDIVPHCLEGIRAVHPSGPYLIAGLCFGGVVALEISRTLRVEGDDVALTVMIDSFAPGAVQTGDTDQPPSPEAEQITRPRASPTRRYHPGRLVRKARQRMWRAAWGPLHRLYQRLGRAMPPWLRDVEEANTIASDSYKAAPYDGDVTLLRATENTDDLDGGPFNGWDEIIRGELVVSDVVGGHVSMYTDPHVKSLAAALTRSIESALDGRTPHRD